MIQVTGDDVPVSTLEGTLYFLPAIIIDDADISCPEYHEALLNVRLEVSRGAIHIAPQHCR